MKTNHVMSLVAATVFALGVAGPALAQTPATPAPSTTPAPSKGDTQMDKMDKKDGKAKHTAKKKAAKKSEGDSAAKAPDTKAPDQPKK
ncbi:MAG TPA: hypothetical protein VJX71_16745 [Methylomirabilota bacterium]|nr:hypothetical protein [Methylomirabilota bacterium]